MPRRTDLNEHVRASQRTGSIAFTIEHRAEDCVTSRMRIDDGVRNPFGTLQAGAIVWLADVTATILAIGRKEIGPNGEGFPLAVNVQTALIANQREGEITAESRYLKNGRRVVVIRTTVAGEGGRLLAEVTSTHVPA